MLMRLVLLTMFLFADSYCLSITPATAAEPVSFKKEIAPILVSQCAACHGTKKAEGGYRLDTFNRAAQAGNSTVRGFSAGKLDESEIYNRLISTDKADRMPKDADPLPAAQIALVKKWIEEGAKYDDGDPTAPLISIVPSPVYANPPPEKYPVPLPITALAFSADGKELFASGYHEITVWNPIDGKLLRRIPGHSQRTYALDISPDGKLLAAAGGTPGKIGEVRVYETATGKLVRVLGPAQDVAWDVAFSPQGDKLAMVNCDATLMIVETASWQTKQTITSHADWVTSVAWSSDGKQVATGSRDRTAKAFDAETGNLLGSDANHKDPVRGAVFNSDGKSLFSASPNLANAITLADGKRGNPLNLKGAEVLRVKRVDDAVLLALNTGKVTRLDKNFGNAREFAGHASSVLCVTMAADKSAIAAAGFDGVVIVWNNKEGKQISRFMAAPGIETPPPAPAEDPKAKTPPAGKPAAKK